MNYLLLWNVIVHFLIKYSSNFLNSSDFMTALFFVKKIMFNACCTYKFALIDAKPPSRGKVENEVYRNTGGGGNICSIKCLKKKSKKWGGG